MCSSDLFISNVATQRGETDDYTAADHYAAIRRHLQDDALVDVVLANSNLPSEPLNPDWHSQPVLAPGDADYGTARLVLADLVDTERRYRHNGETLAAVVMRYVVSAPFRFTEELSGLLLAMMMPAEEATALEWARLSVPAPTVVAPVWVLVAERMSVPAPILVSVRAVASWESAVATVPVTFAAT